MPEPMPIRDLIGPMDDMENRIDALQDGPRKRFIACALQAAAIAVRMDKPRKDIPGLLNTDIEMMRSNLQEWAKEDGLGKK